MTRRILKFLHEEYATALGNFLADTSSSSSYPATPWSVPETPALGNDGTSSFPFAEVRTAGGPLGSMFDLLGHKGPYADGSAGLAATAAHTSSSSAFASGASTAPSSPSSGHHPFPPVPSTVHRPLLPLRTPSIVSTHVTNMLEDDFSRRSHTLKPIFIEAIQELMDEVEMTYRSVGEQSIDHIHSG